MLCTSVQSATRSSGPGFQHSSCPKGRGHTKAHRLPTLLLWPRSDRARHTTPTHSTLEASNVLGRTNHQQQARSKAKLHTQRHACPTKNCKLLRFGHPSKHIKPKHMSAVAKRQSQCLNHLRIHTHACITEERCGKGETRNVEVKEGNHGWCAFTHIRKTNIEAHMSMAPIHVSHSVLHYTCTTAPHGNTPTTSHSQCLGPCPWPHLHTQDSMH